MTVATSVNKAQFLGSGSAGPFTFNMKFFANTEISVVHVDESDIETVLVEGTDYTLTGAGAAVGGAVTLTDALASGEGLTVVRTLPLTQTTSIRNQGAFYPEIHEDTFDRLTMMVQQIDDDAGRSIKMPLSASGDFTVPSGDRADKVLGFDTSGAPVFVAMSGEGVTMHLLGDETAYGVKSFEDIEVRGPADLAAAVAAAGSDRKTIIFSSGITLAADFSSPANVELLPLNGAKIIHGAYAFTYLGSTARWPLAQVLDGTGVVTYGSNTPWDYPEWHGAVADAGTDGSGTDSTIPLQKSFNLVTPTKLTGSYLFSNLTVPPVKTVKGVTIHSTGLISKTGSTGKAFTDQGSAPKVTLEDFAIYGRNQSYTGGLELGLAGGNDVFGTEGWLNHIWVRDFPAGFPGININGNVGHFGRLMAQSTGGIQIVGTGNMVGFVESMQSKGFTVTRYDTTTLQAACNFQDTDVTAIEIEAPDSGVTPLYKSGNTKIGSFWFGPTAGATYPAVVELDPSATSWEIGNLKFYFHTGDAATITGGNFKSGSTYFGGNASGKSHSGEGHYSSSMWLSGRDFAVNNQRIQGFTLSIATTAGGVIQHRITASAGATSNYAATISGASNELTTTPTGDDATTAFAAGAKISSATPSVILLDTDTQVNGDFLGLAHITFNSTGTMYMVTDYSSSDNVNGTTKNRLALQLLNPTTGLPVSWATAVGTEKAIGIRYLGFVK
jgi:hypothetical protein